MASAVEANASAVFSGRSDDCPSFMLEQISQGSPASFTQYCLQIRQKAKDCCSVNSHGSASEVAVGVLGSPCNNHESLHTMAQFKDMNSLFAKAATADELASNWIRVKTVACHWDELLASCRVSLQELKKADRSGAPKQRQRRGEEARSRRMLCTLAGV